MSWKYCHACEKKRGRGVAERHDRQDKRRRDPKEERARSRERTRKRKAEIEYHTIPGPVSPTEDEAVIQEGSLTLKGAKPKGKAAPKSAPEPDPKPADSKTVKEWYKKYQALPMDDWKKIKDFHPRTRCANGCGRRAAKRFDTCCKSCKDHPPDSKGIQNHGPRCDAAAKIFEGVDRAAGDEAWSKPSKMEAKKAGDKEWTKLSGDQEGSDEEQQKKVQKTAEDTDVKTNPSADLRKSLIESVSEYDVTNGDWRNVFDVESLQGEGVAILFEEASFKKKVRNHRTYIGPGADGSSEDKIAVDMKFNAKETTVTFKDEWRTWHKTVIALHQNQSGDNEWRMVQCAVPVQEVYYFQGDDRPSKCAVFIHPPKKEETAYYATRMTPFDDSFVDLFKPDLTHDKVTTMNKTQKGIVKKGEEAIREQDNAM